MPLSGIQPFQPDKIWIPDQNRFGNDKKELLRWLPGLPQTLADFHRG
jgi:hypothetical protein